MDFIFASNNQHKLEEVRSILGKNHQVMSLKELDFEQEIPETEETLQGNALQKARFIYERFKKNCFADDTGLEIEALDLRPGVYSARYAGEHCSFEDNMNKVLSEMQNIDNRTARFRTVIALIINGEEFLFEGCVNGHISREKHGNEGFGYDPIFIPEGNNLSFAEMTIEDKNNISHRGQALAKLSNFLNNL